jgi:hypothetical protein
VAYPKGFRPIEQPRKYAEGFTPVGAAPEGSAFPSPMPHETSIVQTPPWWLSALRRGNEALPSVLSTAAAVPGTMTGNLPLAMLGTAMGPVAGVPLRDRIRPMLGYHIPGTPMEKAVQSVKDVGGEIAANEIALLSGEGLSRVAGAVGQGMRWSAVGPGKQTLRKFPGAKDRFLKSRIPIREGVGEGTEMATAMRTESSQAADRLVAPHSFSLDDIGQPLIGRAEAMNQSRLSPRDRANILRRLRDDMNDLLSHARTGGYAPPPKRLRPRPTRQMVLDAMGNPRPDIPAAPVVYSGEEILAIRRAADEVSSGARNGQRNIYANPSRAMVAGDLARSRINAIPGVAKQNAETQTMIGLTQAVEGAEATAAKPRTNAGEWARLALGLGASSTVGGPIPEKILAGLLAYGIPKAMANPAIRSSTGMWLSGPEAAISARMIPRVALSGARMAKEPEDYK